MEVIISQIQGEIASLEGETGVRSRELLLVFINFIDLVDIVLVLPYIDLNLPWVYM